jgi:hypothetical protein
VDAVDSSQRMLELARGRVGDRVTFHCLDAREFVEGDYDLAVAHFFLDCFGTDELSRMLGHIHTRSWLISEFQKTRWAGPILRGMYLFFRLTTGLRVTALPDYRTALEKRGFRLEKEQKSLAGLLASELWITGESAQP